jgi:hypothetical protein
MDAAGSFVSALSLDACVFIRVILSVNASVMRLQKPGGGRPRLILILCAILHLAFQCASW